MKGLVLILSAVPMTIGMWMLCRAFCGDCPMTYVLLLSVIPFYIWFTPADARL